MQKSTLFLMALLALSSAMFVACGGDDTTDDTTDSSDVDDAAHSGG
jgi:hypothetical protein